MGVKLAAWAWDRPVPPPDKLILLALAERATDENGVCAGTPIKLLAERCYMADRSVSRRIRALERCGALAWQPTTIKGRRGEVSPGPHRYRLLAPWCREGAAVTYEDAAAGRFQRIAARRGCLHSSPACVECARAEA